MRRQIGEKAGQHWAEHVQRSCGSLELQRAEARSQRVRQEQKEMRSMSREEPGARPHTVLWATRRRFIFVLQALESCQRAEVSRVCDKTQWVLEKTCWGCMWGTDRKEFS